MLKVPNGIYITKARKTVSDKSKNKVFAGPLPRKMRALNVPGSRVD